MSNLLVTRPTKATISIRPVLAKDLSKTLKALPANDANWAKANGFKGAAGQIMALPRAKGEVGGYLFGLGKGEDAFAAGTLSQRLPAGTYWLTGPIPGASDTDVAYSWVMGTYKYDRYTKKGGAKPTLVTANQDVAAEANRLAAAVGLTRDLINTPANDLGPEELAQAAQDLAKEFGAKVAITKGKALEEGFPMIHAVGKASPRAPRLIDLTWGRSDAPKVTLVGKGVIFDTGGLNLKPGASMALMKKDMGGSANVLGLAQAIMDANLDIRLRVLIPAVENSVAGNAYRPSDVLNSRKGLTVEIANTDAEGRLVLADALSLGDDEAPDLLIDLATLTGAARVALGPGLPAFYCDDEEFVQATLDAGTAHHDPLWRMPLWQPYMKDLKSDIADINHISAGGFGGSITAALFLSRFTGKAKTYAHLDIYAWNPSSSPARQKGGEACSVRALYYTLKDRYGVTPAKLPKPAAKPASKPKAKPKKKSAKKKK